MLTRNVNTYLKQNDGWQPVGAVMAGVDTREVVEGVELVTTGAEVGTVVGEVTAVAAARLEAW